MPDILAEIFERKASRRRDEERRVPFEEQVRRAEARVGERRDFLAALERAPGIAVIAEIKRASPSAGLIVQAFDPVAAARRYGEASVDAISVLTEEEYFLGDIAYLDMVRAVSTAPILRKDFIATPYEIAASAAAGADAVLLIVAALDDDTLRACMHEARRYELATLVEVHDGTELERALALGARIVGVNNRNLRSLEVDLAVGEALLPRLPRHVFPIGESGMRDERDVARLASAGARGVLIGEALMRDGEPEKKIAAIRRHALAHS
ncbi:MAG: indole-3-glycerol phosphate synthase TrpC [Candidatus Eremiobacteraeota bacterium]|nr:indole-3-glycerol phosphate synthase TrpC [Candidatus Eremiobacteraeota bacterium]